MGGHLTWTSEEILDTAGMLRDRAAELFHKAGYLNVVAFVFVSEPEKGVAIVEPESHDTGREKDNFAAAVAELARRQGAQAIALASEVWMVTGPDVKTARAGHADLSQHPGRQELLYFSLESHRTGVRIWRAPIVRTLGGEGRASGWQAVERPKQAEGRFLHLLAPTS
jgi:hypothetical protein